MIALDAITLAIIARLEATPALAGVRIDADIDFDAMCHNEDLAIEVSVVRSVVQARYAGSTAPREWATQVRLVCGARADGMGAGGRTSSNLLAAADAAITADPFLGGLLTRELLLDEIRPDALQGEITAGAMAALYSCEHDTPADSLAAAP